MEGRSAAPAFSRFELLPSEPRDPWSTTRETAMQIHVAGPFEPPDNPLPTADPAIAPMRRPCMERGCQYRNRALVYGGCLLPGLDLLVHLALVHDSVQVSRAPAATSVDRNYL